MDNIQLFAQLQEGSDYSSYVELDLYEADPIKITKSIQSVEDPQATTSSFSQTYKIPYTNNNGKFFKSVFNVNSNDFNPVKKANAYINVNGAYFISGNIRLNNIITNASNGKIEYEVIFYGQTSTFASVVGPRDLSQISMVEYTHTSSYTNITNSWVNGLFNGDIVYPLAEWGYTYNQTTKQPTVTTLARYNTTNGVKGFTNSNNPLDTKQFKPAIRTKVIWDKIFKDAGFTYTSNFLNSSFFRSIYMISTNSASVTAESELRSDVVLKNKGMDVSGVNDIEFGVVTYDNANAINVSNSTYVAPYTGNYKIQMELLANYSTPYYNPEDNYVIIGLEVLSNGVLISATDGYLYGIGGAQNSSYIYTTIFQGPYGVYLEGTTFTFDVNLTAGSVLTFRIYPGYGGINSFELSNESKIRIIGPDVLDPAGYLPTQYKQLDFIKGINDRFKLMWEPDPQNPTNFFIEPWISWINGGVQKDWTDKLDESSDITITPLFSTQPREYVFKDSEESDLYNFAYQQTNKETFGQLNKDSGIEIITGSKEIKSIFAPLQVAPIGNSDDFLIPHFAKDTETERQPIQVKPRLGFYNGLVSAPVTWYMKNGATSVPKTSYPLLSNFDSYPFNTASFDISWNNVPQFWNPALNLGPSATGGTMVPFDGRTAKTSYNNYWNSWFESTYDPYGRIMKGVFALDSVDIQNLAFNDKIFIKDSWWLPLKVNDFVIGKKNKTSVELLKLGNVGISIGALNEKVYYPYQMTYNQSSATSACCNAKGSYTETVYSISSNLTNQNFLYSDSSGAVNAVSGYYAYNGNVYQVNQSGVIIATSTCSPGDCESLISSSSVAYSMNNPGYVCCSTSGTTTVYFNGDTFYNSSALYRDNLLTIPVLEGWYGINGNSVCVDQNGIVVQIENCATYDCANSLPYSAFVNAVGDYGSNSIIASCCVDRSPSSGSGSIGIVTIYSESEFPSGDLFYYAPDKTSPVAPESPSLLLSDGKNYVNVFNGNKSASGSCMPTSLCANRTYNTTFTITNNSSSSVTLTVVWEISWSSSVWFYNGEATYTLSAGQSTGPLTIKYSPYSSIRIKVSTESVGKKISYNIEDNSEVWNTPGTIISNTTGPCTRYSSISGTITISNS